MLGRFVLFLGLLLTLPTHASRISEKGAKPKTVTFFRHGRSVGNAGVWGAIEVRDVMGYKDGRLVRVGESQAVDRVRFLNDVQLSRVADIPVILVSPLVRAMATSIIIWAEAWKRKYGTVPQKMPRIQVMKELIEKVQSSSERPGSHKRNDPMAYIRSIAEKYDQKLFGGKAACLSNVVNGTGLYESYMQQRTYQDSEVCKQCGGCEKGKPWQPEPRDGICYAATVARFRRRLATEVPESKVMIVAHNGWSRFAFAASLPSPVADSDEDVLHNLRLGSRVTHYLNNCGMIEGKFHPKDGTGVFRDVKVSAIKPGNMSFTNMKLTGRQYAPLLIMDEAHENQRLPKDAKIERALISTYQSGKLVKKVIVLSHCGGVSHLMVGTKWGVPDIDARPQDLKLVRLNDGLASVKKLDSLFQGPYLLFRSPAFSLNMRTDGRKQLKALEKLFKKFIQMPAPDMRATK